MCDRKESGIRTAGKKPDQIGSYFVTEWKPLLAVTVSGLILWLSDCSRDRGLKDGLHSVCWMYLQGKKFFTDMLLLVCAYVAVIGFVQGRALHQAVLCAPVCERYQRSMENRCLRESGT